MGLPNNTLQSHPKERYESGFLGNAFSQLWSHSLMYYQYMSGDGGGDGRRALADDRTPLQIVTLCNNRMERCANTMVDGNQQQSVFYPKETQQLSFICHRWRRILFIWIALSFFFLDLRNGHRKVYVRGW
jgi:hypothetical protein